MKARVLAKINKSNEMLLAFLMDQGAEEVFRMTIRSHRLPSINQMNAVNHWARKKIKDSEKAALMDALLTFDTASLSDPTENP